MSVAAQSKLNEADASQKSEYLVNGSQFDPAPYKKAERRRKRRCASCPVSVMPPHSGIQILKSVFRIVDLSPDAGKDAQSCFFQYRNTTLRANRRRFDLQKIFFSRKAIDKAKLYLGNTQPTRFLKGLPDTCDRMPALHKAR